MAEATYTIPEHADDVFFSTYKGLFNIMDNLETPGEPIIKPRAEVNNTAYTYVTVVLRGTLNMIINNQEVHVKGGEYLVVMPCMRITVLESKCIYFSYLTVNHIVTDIYERSSLGKEIRIRCFCFHHCKFTTEQMQTLLADYLKTKREHIRPDYEMKGEALRGWMTGYLIHLYSFMTPECEIIYTDKSNKYEFFRKFLKLLSEHCKQERSVQYYADRLKISPKYLSTITQTYAGLSASITIDQYVVYEIKRLLYSNDRNIKTIAEIYNFPSQSFFGRYFKRIAGMSPYQYIKENYKNNRSK